MASTRRAYAGGAQSTTTTSAIASSGTTSFTITAYTGWPYGTDPFFIVVEPGTASEEKILVTRTGSTDTTINIASDSERAQDGTSAVGHSSGSVVFPVFTAVDADEANAVASIITADTTNSRIGIGTATPTADLEVSGTSPVVKVTDSDSTGTSNAQIQFRDSSDSLVARVYPGGNDLRLDGTLDRLVLQTGSTDRVTVDSSGNVGINDTTPSYTLDVDGDINATGDLRIGGTAIGEWTSFTTSATNATISAQACEYVRVNDWVYASLYVEFSAVTGNLSVSAPVSGINSAPWNRIGCIGTGFVTIGSTRYVIGMFFTGATTLAIYYTPNGATSAAVNSSTPGAGVDQLRMFVTYKAA